MDDKYKRAKYLGLLGVSLFSFSVLHNQAITTYADTGDTIRSSVVNDGSQEKKSSGGSEDSSQKISNSDSQVTDTNSDSTGKTNASDTSKIQSPVTKSALINDTSGSDGSDDTANTGTNGAGRVSSIGVNDGQVETEDTTTPVVAAPKNLVVIKKNDSSVHLDNQLKISTDSTANIKKVTSSNPDNSTYDDTTKIVTITAPTATDAVTAEYGVVGTYRGKSVTAKVTINNLVKHTEDHPAPSNLPANEIQIKFHPDFGGGIETYNVAQDEVTIAFFDEQGNQVTIDNDGYITVGSLNGPSTSTMGNKYVNYDNPNTSTYITEDSVVQYQANPVTGTGDAYVGTSSDFTDKLGAPTSENGAVTFQLSGSSFTFLNGTTRYTLKNSNHHWSYALTTFNSATVAPAIVSAPALSVDKDLARSDETVNYTLSQQVNALGEDTMLRYQSWSEVVTLPTEVSYRQATLLDSTGTEINDAVFSWNSEMHELAVTLPEDYLQYIMPLNGETYQLKINMLVNNNVINGDIGKAFGRASIDDIEKSSNSVGTMYVAPVIMTPADQAGPVIVRYFSAQGILRKKITLKGKLGESYTTSIKTPKYESGYTVDQTRWPRNAQGIFSKDTTYVDYYYAAPIDSWKAYQDQTQINTVISGNNKLMGLNVYYPNGAKVSLTITRENKIQVHTISPNGYSTKTIILTIGDERDITDSDGSTHWIKVLGNGNVYLWYMYDYGQITDVVNGQGQLLKHKFIKMNKVHVNTISQVTSPREQRYRNNEALNQSPNSRKLKVNLSESNSRPSKFNFHIYSDSLISHETNSAQVLPQTGDHRGGSG